MMRKKKKKRRNRRKTDDEGEEKEKLSILHKLREKSIQMLSHKFIDSKSGRNCRLHVISFSIVIL